jgi:hypothetical protein
MQEKAISNMKRDWIKLLISPSKTNPTDYRKMPYKE